MAAILDFEVRMTSRLQNDHSSGFVMQKLVENDISFAFLALVTVDILHFMFFIIATAAILNNAL